MIDPASGEAAEPVDPLVRSRGAEVGLRATPANGLNTTLSFWTLELDSELLFVGDAGTTEASDASERVGVTMANFWRFDPTWSADIDLSLTRARKRIMWLRQRANLWMLKLQLSLRPQRQRLRALLKPPNCAFATFARRLWLTLKPLQARRPKLALRR